MAAEEWVGRIIDQRYVVESGLGAGGMGVVLRAKHRFTGQTVALKVLKPELSNDPAIQSRFLAEAQAPNAIGHPGIVRVHDAGRDPSGFLYLVMELLEGRSLRVPMVRGELGPLDASRIMLELLDALATAHARGFVHRDLKPDNVFLVAPHDTMKLLDFGIAKVLDAAVARVRTATGITMGTPAYMSPEQLSDAAGVDGRTDLWACGVILYEMLSGRLPYAANRPEQLLVAIATQNPDPIRAYLPQAPVELEGFFSRALSRDPRTRFGAAAEMAHALTQLPLHQLRPAVAVAGPQVTPPASYAASYPGSQAPGSPVGAHATPMPPQPHATPLPSMQHAGHTTPVPPHGAPYAAPSATHEPRTRSSTQPPPTKKSSPATLIVGLAAAAAVIVLVVLLVMKRSGGTSTAKTGSGSDVGSGSQVATSGTGSDDGSGSSGSGSAGGTAVATGPFVPGPGDLGNGILKQRLDRIAQGSDGSGSAVPTKTATTTTPTTTTPATPRPQQRTNPPVTTQEPDDPYDAPTGAKTFTCDEGCRGGERCGIVTNHASCLAECAANAAEKQCYDLAAANNCPAAAQCGIAATCGSRAKGTATCLEAFVCQAACGNAGGDTACVCRCTTSVQPSQALALFRADACVVKCGGNNDGCLKSQCRRPLEACLGMTLEDLEALSKGTGGGM